MLGRLSSFSGPLSNFFSTIKGFLINGLILRYEIKNRDTYNGTSTVVDLQGNSNGSLLNSPGFSSNGYLNFDGTNDYLMTNTSLNPDLSPANTSSIISYFIWIYPQDNGVIVTEQGTATLNTSWHDAQIEMVTGALNFGLWTGIGLTSLTSSISTPINEWYYVGLTYDGTTLRAYVNAQLAGSLNLTRTTPYSASVGLHYGIAAADFTNMGDGSYAKVKVGDFHVYNRVLSQQQILNNYNATKSNYIYADNMLIWIDANDPQSFVSGTSVSDMSGNNYTHTLTSGAAFTNLYGVKSFDCTTVNKRIVVDGTGPTLPTTGYTYVVWARILSSNSSFRTLLYTNSPKYTPITIPDGSNILGYWDTAFRSSGYDISSLGDTWVQYSVVGDNSSQIFYINDSQVGSSISYGSGGTTHWGLGNNDLAGQPFGYVGNMMLYNTKLTSAQIKQNYDALKHVYTNSNFITSNLRLYFNPDNLTSYPGSGTAVNDLSGNSLNGTMSNVTFNYPSFTYNGTNSQVSISDNSLLEPGSGDWTIEVWVNQTVSTGGQVILGKFDPGGGAQDVSYAVRVLNGSVRADFGNGSTAINTSSYALNSGSWYQLTYVFNNVANNNIITYVNGVEQSTTTHSFSSILNTTANLYLGSYNNGEYSQYFNGKIGITRIYESALGSSDVLTNFNANRERYGL